MARTFLSAIALLLTTHTHLCAMRYWPSEEHPLGKGALTLEVNTTKPSFIELTPNGAHRPNILYLKTRFGGPRSPGIWIDIPPEDDTVLLYQEQTRNLLLTPARDTRYHAQRHATVCFDPLVITACSDWNGERPIELEPRQVLKIRNVEPHARRKDEAFQRWLRTGVHELKNPKPTSPVIKKLEAKLWPEGARYLKERNELRWQAVAAFEVMLRACGRQP